MKRITFRILLVAAFLLTLVALIDGDNVNPDAQRVYRKAGKKSKGKESTHGSGSNSGGGSGSPHGSGSNSGGGSGSPHGSGSNSGGGSGSPHGSGSNSGGGSGSPHGSGSNSGGGSHGSGPNSGGGSHGSGSNSGGGSHGSGSNSGGGSPHSHSHSHSGSSGSSSSGSGSGEPEECFDGICPCDDIHDNDAPGNGPDFNCPDDEDQCSLLMYYLQRVLMRLITIIDMWREKLFALRCYLDDYIDYLKDADCEQVLCAITTCLKDILAYLCIYY